MSCEPKHAEWGLYDYAIVGWKDGDRTKMPELLFASKEPRVFKNIATGQYQLTIEARDILRVNAFPTPQARSAMEISTAAPGAIPYPDYELEVLVRPFRTTCC